MKKFLPLFSLLLLSACSVTQHTDGAFNDACVGVPSVVVNCILIWLGIAAFAGIFLNNFSAAIMSIFMKLSDSSDENYKSNKYMAYVGAIIAIGALVCYYVFMYPDSQAIASGASACGSVINQ